MEQTPYLLTYSPAFSFASGATRAHVGGARAREHLSRALGEIDGLFPGLERAGRAPVSGHVSRALGEVDGLFAGMKYVDETQPLDETSQPSSEPDDLALEIEALWRDVPPQPPNPQPADETAWSSVRHVRDGMQCHWRHFVQVSQDLKMPIIDDLREMYEDARGLREAGVFAFRHTLTGPAPNSLREVFAFCSLSYVVCRLLHARGRFEKTEILAGITLWLNALENPKEREAFKNLAERLWPEAHYHLHFLELNLSPSAQQAVATLLRSDYAPTSIPIPGAPPLSALSALHDSNLEVPRFPAAEPATQDSFPWDSPAGEGYSDNTYKVTDATDETVQLHGCQFPPFDPSSAAIAQPYYDTGQSQYPDPNYAQSFDNSYNQTTDTNYREIPNPSYLPFPDTSYNQLSGPSYCFPDSSLYTQSAPQPDTLELPATGNVPASPTELPDTPIFTAVLQYCRDNGDFWYDLSGRGAISKDSKSLLSWNLERTREKERIHEQYLRQLVSEKNTKDAPSRGIISVAEAFVGWGYLQSVDEAKNYMKAIGKSLFSNVGAHDEFLAWISPKRANPPGIIPHDIDVSSEPRAKESFPCPICLKEFSRKWNMERHCEDIHDQKVEREGDQKRREKVPKCEGCLTWIGQFRTRTLFATSNAKAVCTQQYV
ncbi:hypothetical protein N0V84_006722 [Fusarium piperis]|uniref:C2H2-type domain-containing protein n=1 Tax=Fusarium piperis TaxID=1435070 RepID=A0A9W8WBJ7_9HYPO|nr:hypothetical protein N0V84_006722 [Fusarium piperis]